MTELTVRTRGGWSPTGTAAGRRATIRAGGGHRAAHTRQRLLDAARRAAARHGYADTTVEHIVAEAGMARGSFYTYFESKRHLFALLVASIDDEVERHVVGFDRRDTDPVENLARSNRNYLAVVKANADLYDLVDQMAAHDPEIRAGRLRSRQRHTARVTRSIRRWQRNGWADPTIDAELTAAALVSMLSSFAQWAYVGGDTYDDERAAATLTTIWVQACALRPPQ